MTLRDFSLVVLVMIGIGWLPAEGFAQDSACDNLMDVCGQTDTTATTNSSLDLPGSTSLVGVFDADWVQAVTFHTTFFNQFADPLEPAQIRFSNLQCDGPLWARVFQPNPFDVCNAAEYVAVSDIWTIQGDTTLLTVPLYQNSDYVLLVGSSSEGCALDVRLEGLALSMDACCATTLDYGEAANVEVLGTDPALGFDWTPEDLAEMVDNQLAELSPYETTTFEVTGYIEGCAYSDALLIAVGSPIDAPNAFSPNNDGYNDTWDIYGLSQFPSATIEVFDRWGQSVFRSVSYPNPWAGKSRGVDVPTGTYYYVIHLNEPNANLAPVTGHVAVIR